MRKRQGHTIGRALGLLCYGLAALAPIPFLFAGLFGLLWGANPFFAAFSVMVPAAGFAAFFGVLGLILRPPRR